MNIIVTGGAGFIGSHVARLLSERGHRVMVIDNFKTGKTENLKGFRGAVELCDITDIELLKRKFDSFRPAVVHHLAAQSAISVSERDPAYDAMVNIIGTLNLLSLSRAHGVMRFIFSSTSAVYAPMRFFASNERSPLGPQNPYGISKLASENYVRTSGIAHVILRYGNVYGSRQVAIGENQVIARALAHFERGDDFKVTGDGNQKRDFVHVNDVAYLHWLLTTATDITGTYNLATGKSHSVNEMLSTIAELYGVSGYKWEHTKRPDPRGNVFIDSRKIRIETGMRFTNIRDGLSDTIHWWQKGEKHD